MNGPEIHPAVDADKIQARKEAEALQEEVEKTVKQIIAHGEALKRAELKKADRSLLCKALVNAGALVIFESLERAGLMAGVLVQILELGALLWYFTYFGAWMQFRFGKGRLIK